MTNCRTAWTICLGLLVLAWMALQAGCQPAKAPPKDGGEQPTVEPGETPSEEPGETPSEEASEEPGEVLLKLDLKEGSE